MTDAGPALHTERLLLSPPRVADAPAMADFQYRNADFLAPWSPPRPEGFFTTPFWEERLGYFETEEKLGIALRFVLRQEGRIVGAVNFNNILRGCSFNCWLGYSLDREVEGKGLMFEALSAAIPHVFDVVGLHLVQAGHLPENVRSGRLLRRMGFTPFGYARDYLYIGGAWRDHVLQGLLNPRETRPG